MTNTFHFDGYGMDLGWGRDTDVEYNQVNQPATDMLYSGEQYDTPLQMQYLRARYYQQNVGTFNRLDDYAGSMQDPQSLHKYAYCHGDPVNGIDPSGESWILLALIVLVVVLILAAINLPTVQGKRRARALKAYNDIIDRADRLHNWNTDKEKWIKQWKETWRRTSEEEGNIEIFIDGSTHNKYDGVYLLDPKPNLIPQSGEDFLRYERMLQDNWDDQVKEQQTELRKRVKEYYARKYHEILPLPKKHKSIVLRRTRRRRQ